MPIPEKREMTRALLNVRGVWGPHAPHDVRMSVLHDKHGAHLEFKLPDGRVYEVPAILKTPVRDDLKGKTE